MLILSEYTVVIFWLHIIFSSLTSAFIILRAETERGLSRKHIIEGKVLLIPPLSIMTMIIKRRDSDGDVSTGLRGSLSRLQLDYVDIVFANRNDVNSPMEGLSSLIHLLWHVLWINNSCYIVYHKHCCVYVLSEVVRAMTFVINQGMAMYWGTSRWSAMEIMVGSIVPQDTKVHSISIPSVLHNITHLPV